jgi:Family of unknown function (DUF6325)
MSAQQSTKERAEEQTLVGPIDYLAVEFPGARLTGEGLAALLDLVSQGIIRILDLRVAKVDESGNVTIVAITDLDGDGVLDLAVFEGVQSGILGDDDVAESAALVQPGNAVGLLLYENTWAGPAGRSMASRSSSAVLRRGPRSLPPALRGRVAAWPARSGPRTDRSCAASMWRRPVPARCGRSA